MTFIQRSRAARRALSSAPVLLSALAGPMLSGCERVRTALNPPKGNPIWEADSTLVASRPTVLYRVLRGGRAPRIVPIATAGGSGFEPMLMSDRGWRLFDLTYMQSSASVVPVRRGEGLSKVPITRGMWEGGAPLDTLRGCNLMPPAALVNLPADVDLVSSSDRPRPAGVGGLSDGELQTALSAIPTLIAPSAGVPPSLIGRYARTVSVVPTGATKSPTIVITYDDPDAVPDSVPPMAQRPRELIVVLDRGIYGYRPSYVFKTVANNKDLPRRKFLDAFDADGDGRAELFFGLQGAPYVLVTYALRWETDAWHESFRYERGRCHG